MEKDIPGGYSCTYKSDTGNIVDSPGCFCKDPPVDRQCDFKWDLIKMRQTFEAGMKEMEMLTSRTEKEDAEAKLKQFYDEAMKQYEACKAGDKTWCQTHFDCRGNDKCFEAEMNNFMEDKGKCNNFEGGCFCKGKDADRNCHEMPLIGLYESMEEMYQMLK